MARQGVSAYPPEVTAQMVQVFRDGGAAINQLAAAAGAKLWIGELGVATPCGDISEGPALTESEFLRGVSYGMEAADEAGAGGADLLLLGEMGIGNTTAAAALSLALAGGKPEDWVGRGTGLSDEGLLRKRRIVAAARDATRPRSPPGRWRSCASSAGWSLLPSPGPS